MSLPAPQSKPSRPARSWAFAAAPALAAGAFQGGGIAIRASSSSAATSYGWAQSRLPSLSEINARIRALGLHELGRKEYLPFLAGCVLRAGRQRSLERLTLSRRRHVIAAHHLPAWWAVVATEPELARDLLLTILLTGMRQSRAMALRWDCLDLSRRILYVPQRGRGDWLRLPIAAFVAALFAERRLSVGRSEWVFPGRGRSGHFVDGKLIVRRVAGRSGIPFCIEDLRRTFLAVAESLGVPAHCLRSLLCLPGGGGAHEVERLREPAERIAARILKLAKAG